MTTPKIAGHTPEEIDGFVRSVKNDIATKGAARIYPGGGTEYAVRRTAALMLGSHNADRLALLRERAELREALEGLIEAADDSDNQCDDDLVRAIDWEGFRALLAKVQP